MIFREHSAGEPMETTDKICADWDPYDKSVAKCHLSNYGIIYLDDYGWPIDDFEWLEDLIEGKAGSF